MTDATSVQSGLATLGAAWVVNEQYTKDPLQTALATKVAAIGEVQSATRDQASAVALTNNTAANVLSLDLTAGEWTIDGMIDFLLSGVTGTFYQAGISLVSAALPGQPGGSGLGPDALAMCPMITTVLSGSYQLAVGPTHLSLSAPQTIYLVARQTFTLGSSSAFGTIRATRRKAP